MKWIGILALVALALYGAYAWAFPSATIRYRLTLEAEVDGKPVVGSGVIQVTRQDTQRVFGVLGGTGATIKGEAVALDLAERGTLFALLHGHRVHVAEDDAFPTYVYTKAFSALLAGTHGLEQTRLLIRLRPKTDLPLRLLPLMVRFRDINEPKSVELVDPANLAAAFGPGVALKHATIEITDDPVTRGIELRLPWLKRLNGKYLDRGSTLDDAAFGLHGGNFQLGVK